MIGYDGMVEINAAGHDGRLVIGTGTDRCIVDLKASNVADEADGPPLHCIAATVAAREHDLPHKVARRD